MKILALCLLTLEMVACATYQGKIHESRSLLKSGQPEKAVVLLEKLAKEEGKDQLVYLLDYAIALQQAGEYKKSTDALLSADRMSEIKDYHSITKQTASILLNEEQVQYKGEDYEKILINAVLAINFLMMNQLDEALVEARRINEKIEHYRVDAKKTYTQNEFALYLTALLWEADRKWDSAYISYLQTYKVNPNIKYLQKDLLRSAQKAQRRTDMNKWQKQFNIKPDKSWGDSNQGELVLILAQGWGPRKYPNPKFHRLPKLFPVESYVESARLVVDGNIKEDSQVIHSVEASSMKTLNDQYDALIAKRLAAIAAKEVVADQIRQKDELLGALATIAMRVSDRADLRQWSTLPESFQVARLSLPPGAHKVSAIGLDDEGDETSEVMPEKEIIIEPGRKTFVFWRTLK